MKSSFRTIERFKKHIRKIVKSTSRFFRFQNEIYSNENDDDDKQLNIKFIETILFYILTKSNDQKFDVKIFQITLQQSNVVIFQILQIYYNDFDNVEINAIFEQIFEKNFIKIFKFFKKFRKILNSKQIEHFSRNAKHDHKIEFIDDSNILFKNRIYSLSIRQFEILQIYILKKF